MRAHDMKYIGFKHQREKKQNSDNGNYVTYLTFINVRENREDEMNGQSRETGNIWSTKKKYQQQHNTEN